ncbi:branched-chain amino acid ABC transporter permease [Sorangium sp. So ce448]|uniref:branched-chain amino acid ABC transporter permease n=1 Tax=Sorangium sp. So ce448 TaxID=3133314 RepID=UPI003F624C69
MLITLALMASFPLWAEHVGLYQYLGIEVAIWTLYALGYNLLMGYTGLPAFGQGAFLGVGAYVYGLCYLNWSQNPLICLALGAVAGGVGAALVGALVAHRRGIYFALLTIACGQVFWFVAMKAHSITGGEDGLLNVRRPALAGLDLGDNVTLYYVVLAILALAIVALWRLVHSPFGKALQAIRMNESRARFVGYNVWLTKWAVIALSGVFAGLAGGLLAVSQESAYPDVMSVHSSGFIVMAVLIGGGTVSFWGPVLGALVFIVARDLLGAATETWLLWYGLLFMAVVLFQPEGIAGAFQHHRAKLLGRSRAAGPEQLPTEAENGSV